MSGETDIEYLYDDNKKSGGGSVSNSKIKSIILILVGVYMLNLWVKLGDMVLKRVVLKEKYGIQGIAMTAVIVTLLFILLLYKFNAPVPLIN